MTSIAGDGGVPFDVWNRTLNFINFRENDTQNLQAIENVYPKIVTAIQNFNHVSEI